MTKIAVDGFRSERDVLESVLRALTDDEWTAPSGCEGWSVQDVVTHLSSTLQLVADPEHATFPDPSLGAEAGLDAIVSSRRGQSPDQALATWLDVSAKAVDAFEALQTEGIAESELDMGDLGTHPMHMIPGAYAFDQYTHLRIDLLPPRGPLGVELPTVEPVVLEATVEWLLAGLPQMCTAALKPAMTAPWLLRLTGPGGGTWTIAPTDAPDRACVVREGDDGSAVFSVESEVEEFVRWSTHRASWRGLVTIDLDEEQATRVLDAVHLV